MLFPDREGCAGGEVGEHRAVALAAFGGGSDVKVASGLDVAGAAGEAAQADRDLERAVGGDDDRVSDRREAAVDGGSSVEVDGRARVEAGPARDDARGAVALGRNECQDRAGVVL